MYDDHVFFQLAAGLIPAVLFGGWITGAFVPQPRLRRLPRWKRVKRLVGVVVAVTLVLVAELSALDLATSPDRPSSVIGGIEVSIVVLAVVAVTAIAGAALLRPWIRVLLTRRERRSKLVVVPLGIGLLLYVGASLVLTRSITQAESRLADQRGACLSGEINRRIRESRLDAFAAEDQADARMADIQQLDDERIRLRQQRGLTPSERRSREESLRQRAKLARERLTKAQKQYGEHLVGDVSGLLPRGLTDDLDRTEAELTEFFYRAYGC